MSTAAPRNLCLEAPETDETHASGRRVAGSRALCGQSAVRRGDPFTTLRASLTATGFRPAPGGIRAARGRRIRFQALDRRTRAVHEHLTSQGIDQPAERCAVLHVFTHFFLERGQAVHRRAQLDEIPCVYRPFAESGAVRERLPGRYVRIGRTRRADSQAGEGGVGRNAGPPPEGWRDPRELVSAGGSGKAGSVSEEERVDLHVTASPIASRNTAKLGDLFRAASMCLPIALAACTLANPCLK